MVNVSWIFMEIMPIFNAFKASIQSILQDVFFTSETVYSDRLDLRLFQIPHRLDRGVPETFTKEMCSLNKLRKHLSGCENFRQLFQLQFKGMRYDRLTEHE